MGVARKAVVERAACPRAASCAGGATCGNLPAARRWAARRRSAGSWSSMKSQLLGELLDRIAAVAEDALVAVEKRDGAGGRAGVDVAFVERDVAGLGPQLGDIESRARSRCRRRPANRSAWSPIRSLATSLIEAFLSHNRTRWALSLAARDARHNCRPPARRRNSQLSGCRGDTIVARRVEAADLARGGAAGGKRVAQRRRAAD